jgi:Zn-dependent M28 family amino/carboxypeptidase
MKLRFLLLTVFLLLLACTGCAIDNGGAPQALQNSITADAIRIHVATLADDKMEGRGPGAPGGELAAKYLADQFEQLGLEPAGDDGTWFQQVPMVSKEVTNAPSLRVTGSGAPMTFGYKDDFVGGSELEDARVNIEGELVFAGYGITAPENNWNDFKGQDMKGKVLVLLVNDPPAPAEEPGLFGGKALTYYGRWTYKFEEAARQGAAGAILVHTTESAGYGWNVVRSSWSGEGFSLERGPNSNPPLPMAAWVSQDAAEEIFKRAGKDLQELQLAATSRDFEPVPLGLKASTAMRQTVKRSTSPNVAGLLQGSDPALASQYVIFTAHYDHLGIDRNAEGDGIYNGAFDNASGCAATLAIAEAYAKAETQPRRSVLFLMVTAEEQGLLGSAYYAQNPLLPLKDTAANVNIDGLNIIGPTRDVFVVGHGKSNLDAVVSAAARAQGMTAIPDQHPEQGFYYRSDQFSLAKVGVPAVYLDNGLDVIGQPEGYGLKKFDEYNAMYYHQPSDELRDDWNWDGALQHTRLLLDIAWRITQADAMPVWNEGDEFKAIRDASLQGD